MLSLRDCRLRINDLKGLGLNAIRTVDEFVAVRASKINSLQQLSITRGFCDVESKGLPEGKNAVEHLVPNQIPLPIGTCRILLFPSDLGFVRTQNL